MNVRIEGTKLIIEVEANTINPPPSSTGKTLLVASESGKTSINVLGKQLSIAINATVKAA